MEFHDLRVWIVITIMRVNIHYEECFLFKAAFAEAEDYLLDKIVGPSDAIQPGIDRKMFPILP